ncbi:1-phosphofructokinase [Nakamurella panacisegetis]|uniref:1-phosphofructokinase n=1 Tax=Nakamurella panacisegetis TaxID=1090615 RepID=A0A1H0K8A4_9ACTN|nr:PfkB family carbohydrate kinase [Nakamurella panacisegetis]SDO51950.1 1-phosphofructokinase [Nakamurella panacisegetis]
MLIAAPNLCLDITIRLAALVPGTVARAGSTDTSAGSKGVNVARAAKSIGARPVIAGFLPHGNGDRLLQLLDEEQLELQHVPVDGELRLATILLEDSGRVTMVNGRGAFVSTQRWQQYAELVAQAAPGRHVLVCSGSLPPGLPTDAYRRLVQIGHLAGLPVIVDAAPDVLRDALPAEPDLVSPNLSEAEGLLLGRVGEEVDEQGDDIPGRAVEAAVALHARGAVRAVVTAGAHGAALATSAGSWWLPALPVDVVNPIGAGDCFAAGAANALMAGADDLDIVRHGMSVAAAACETPTAGRLNPARAAALFEMSTAEPIPAAAR